MKRGFLFAALLAGVAAVVSCTRTPLERAVSRELLPSEANVVVTDHCQSCHTHVDFLADAHMVRMKAAFPTGSAFREAKECLECHNLRLKNIFRSERRRTTRPHGALVKMSEIPRPREARPSELKKRKAEKKKKEKKWYFFYLF